MVGTCPAVGAVTMEMFQPSKAEHKNKQMEGRLRVETTNCHEFAFRDDIKTFTSTEENRNSCFRLLIKMLLDALPRLKSAQTTPKVTPPDSSIVGGFTGAPAICACAAFRFYFAS